MSQPSAAAQPVGPVLVLGAEEDAAGMPPYYHLEASDPTVTSSSRLPITVPVINTTETTAASKEPKAPVIIISEDFLISDTGSEEHSATSSSQASSHVSSRPSSHASSHASAGGERREPEDTPAVFVVTPHSLENVTPTHKPLENSATETAKSEQAASAIALQEAGCEDVTVVLPPAAGCVERQPARKKKWTRFFSFLRKRSSETSAANLRENARADQQ